MGEIQASSLWLMAGGTTEGGAGARAKAVGAALRHRMPHCRLQITASFLHFRAVPHQGFLDGPRYGESTVYWLKICRAVGVVSTAPWGSMNAGKLPHIVRPE
jgi:hypothetical protein